VRDQRGPAVRGKGKAAPGGHCLVPGRSSEVPGGCHASGTASTSPPAAPGCLALRPSATVPACARGPGEAAGSPARRGDAGRCLTARRSSHRLLPSHWQEAESKHTSSRCCVSPSFLATPVTPVAAALLSPGSGVTEMQTPRRSQYVHWEERAGPCPPHCGRDPVPSCFWVFSSCPCAYPHKPLCPWLSCPDHPAVRPPIRLSVQPQLLGPFSG